MCTHSVAANESPQVRIEPPIRERRRTADEIELCPVADRADQPLDADFTRAELTLGVYLGKTNFAGRSDL
jgi:hypothetical protein